MHQKTCHDSHSQGGQRPPPVILDVRLPGKNLPMTCRRCNLTGQCIIAAAQALHIWHPKRCWAQDGRCGCPSVVQVTDVNSFSNWACLPAPPATRSSGPGPALSCCLVQLRHAQAFVEICVMCPNFPKTPTGLSGQRSAARCGPGCSALVAKASQALMDRWVSQEAVGSRRVDVVKVMSV